MKLDPMLERCLDAQDLDTWSEEADATTLARLHRRRWGIERAFLHPAMHLRREVHTLSHSPMAPSRLPASQNAGAFRNYPYISPYGISGEIMASAPHQYEYSVISYLNEATVLLRMSTADVLPKWTGISSLRDVNNAGARLLATIAESVSELLVTKLSLTGQLQAETDNDARWNIYNQMSGLRNGVRNREAKAQRGVTAALLLTNALKLLTEFDAKLTVLLNEAHQLNSLMQGVASKPLKDPVPQNVATLLDDIHKYNDSSKAVFWNLLDPNRSWNLDKERINIINRLGTVNEYPQASVLWARWLCPQVEAIEQKASSIVRDVQLRRGTWHLIENYLGNVDWLLGKEDADGRMSWYEDAFSILAKTQLRMMKEVVAQCAEYS